MSFAQPFTFIRNLSLDVVLGALASGSMVVWMLETPMPLIWWIALPIAVWVIYTTDHLLDAYRLREKAHTPRHLFHYQHFKLISAIWIILLLSCMTWVAYQVPQQMLLLAFGMGALVLLHLGLVWWVGNRVSWFFHKELGVALIYACGVWGGPLVMFPNRIDPGVGLMFTQFFLLALINLLFFSMYEAEIDQKDGHSSFSRYLGGKGTQNLILVLALITAILGGIVFALHPPTKYLVTESILAAMLILLLAISYFPKYFGQAERYRYWGDGAFLFPGLVWIFSYPGFA